MLCPLPPMSTEQCAIGPDGQLLPASEIVFYNDPDDPAPLPSAPPSHRTLRPRTIGDHFTQIRPARTQAVESSKRKASAELPQARQKTSRRSSRAVTASSRAVSPRSRAVSASSRAVSASSRAVSASSRAVSASSRAVSASSRGVSPPASSRGVSPLSRAVSRSSHGSLLGPDAETFVDGDEVPGLNDASDDDRDDEGSDAEEQEDEDDYLQAYQQMVVSGDTDRTAMQSVPKADRTKDIDSIFSPGSIIVNNKEIQGWWCRLCKKKLGAVSKTHRESSNNNDAISTRFGVRVAGSPAAVSAPALDVGRVSKGEESTDEKERGRTQPEKRRQRQQEQQQQRAWRQL
ncbi:unnamed protein product [Mycena citricolor]|uniref:Uncharacterized protein n=1 Tax=Mycena citricolor TaxID=2018698 RepID=A0AAD2HAR2_9AGAR|nr:unnamed protein product [Mycena citricolor]